MKARLIVLLLGLGWSALSLAAIDTYEFADQGQRLRYHELIGELRCPKCQNQDIADSNAPIAKDLRDKIYQQLRAGQSDQQIIDYLVARYGEFVLYRPRMESRTLLLWYGPGAMLLAGFVLIGVIVLRRRARESGADESLSTDEAARLADLLNQVPVDKKEP